MSFSILGRSICINRLSAARFSGSHQSSRSDSHGSKAPAKGKPIGEGKLAPWATKVHGKDTTDKSGKQGKGTTNRPKSDCSQHSGAWSSSWYPSQQQRSEHTDDVYTDSAVEQRSRSISRRSSQDGHHSVHDRRNHRSDKVQLRRSRSPTPRRGERNKQQKWDQETKMRMPNKSRQSRKIFERGASPDLMQKNEWNVLNG